MTVFATGDMHGIGSILKLAPANFDQDDLTRDDYVIILGDFGLPWQDREGPRDRWWLDWLESRPFTTLFVDGNHENFDALGDYPTTEWHGGSAQRLRGHVMHLMRGQAYEIGGMSFFCMGGAHSVDKELRTPHESWWPQEAPSREERAAAEAKVAAVGSVDYVLTHCPPAEALLLMGASLGFDARPDELNSWLQREVANKLLFKRWLFGHMHADWSAPDLYACLFNRIVELDGSGDLARTSLQGEVLWRPRHANPVGSTTAELADFVGCSPEDAERAANIGCYGCTCGIDPGTGEELLYDADFRRFFAALGMPGDALK